MRRLDNQQERKMQRMPIPRRNRKRKSRTYQMKPTEIRKIERIDEYRIKVTKEIPIELEIMQVEVNGRKITFTNQQTIKNTKIFGEKPKQKQNTKKIIKWVIATPFIMIGAIIET